MREVAGRGMVLPLFFDDLTQVVDRLLELDKSGERLC
jgi:hypothetical protein